MLGSFSLPVPPPGEQAAVAEYLDGVTGDLSGASAQCSDAIRLLAEYRTRLIADVVTGKRDVRDAAAAFRDIDPLVAEEGPNDSMELDAGLQGAHA